MLYFFRSQCTSKITIKKKVIIDHIQINIVIVTTKNFGFLKISCKKLLLSTRSKIVQFLSSSLQDFNLVIFCQNYKWSFAQYLHEMLMTNITLVSFKENQESVREETNWITQCTLNSRSLFFIMIAVISNKI